MYRRIYKVYTLALIDRYIYLMITIITVLDEIRYHKYQSKYSLLFNTVTSFSANLLDQI